jgi:perosamine synthetase
VIPVNRPLISESDKKAVLQGLEQTWISGETPPIQALENSLAAYVGTEYAVAVSTGTTAIDLSIECLGLSNADECILPTFTIMSTVNNLLRKKANLTLIDCDSSTWSMSGTEAREAITHRTKLVLPVHIYGLPVEMDEFLPAARDVGAFVLEDAAEALGVKYKQDQCGSLGDASIFSFYANKIITGGEGGAICTNSSEFYEKLKYTRNLCFDPQNRFMHSDLGWNFRMSGMVAALIQNQLLRIEKLIETKRAIANTYLEGLANHPWFDFMPPKTLTSTNNFWVFPVLLNDSSKHSAETFQKEIREKGIETRRFFMPIHLQPVMQSYEFKQMSDLSQAENIWNRGVYLPSGLGNTQEEIEKVIECCWSMI